MVEPRVLVVSHNVFSSSGNMGKTMMHMLAGIPPDNLAQLYFHQEIPTRRCCLHYFRMTDSNILHYPDRWQEYVTIRQEQNGNTIAVTFETKSGEETYELFKVLIGDDSSEVVGSLTDDTGTQRNVYLHVEELPADSGLEETEQTRFYAMQEDLNYLIDHLS